MHKTLGQCMECTRMQYMYNYQTSIQSAHGRPLLMIWFISIVNLMQKYNIFLHQLTWRKIVKVNNLHLTSFRAPGRLTCTYVKLNITNVILLFSTLFWHTDSTDIPIKANYNYKMLRWKVSFLWENPRYFGSSLVQYLLHLHNI